MELFYDDSKDLSEGEIIEIDGDIQNQVAIILPPFRKEYGHKFAAAPYMYKALREIRDLEESYHHLTPFGKELIDVALTKAEGKK